MASPFDLAWMVLKQWEDLPENWGQPDAPALQYSDDPEMNQMITPWPEGTAIGWERGPPVDGQQGPVLSAEEAIFRQQQRMRGLTPEGQPLVGQGTIRQQQQRMAAGQKQEGRAPARIRDPQAEMRRRYLMHQQTRRPMDRRDAGRPTGRFVPRR